MIEKINFINKISQINGNSNIKNIKPSTKNDTISISSDAKLMSEIYAIREKVDAVPDVREERVKEVMKKMEDPNYINDTVLRATANKIMDLFGI